MRFTYDRDRDSAYVELASVWKGTGGWSNVALVAADYEAGGARVECHFFFTERDELKALMIQHASRWIPMSTLDAAEPFEPWDGVERAPSFD
jgi:hypothetical protein